MSANLAELIVNYAFKFFGFFILIIAGVAIGINFAADSTNAAIILASLVLLVDVAFDTLKAYEDRRSRSKEQEKEPS